MGLSLVASNLTTSIFLLLMRWRLCTQLGCQKRSTRQQKCIISLLATAQVDNNWASNQWKTQLWSFADLKLYSWWRVRRTVEAINTPCSEKEVQQTKLNLIACSTSVSFGRIWTNWRQLQPVAALQIFFAPTQDPNPNKGYDERYVMSVVNEQIWIN